MDVADEPGVYLGEHIKEELLRDPEVGELDLHVIVDGKRIVVTGNVSTSERHDAISRVVHGLLPDHDIRNETTVTAYPEAPGDEPSQREVIP